MGTYCQHQGGASVKIYRLFFRLQPASVCHARHFLVMALEVPFDGVRMVSCRKGWDQNLP